MWEEIFLTNKDYTTVVSEGFSLEESPKNPDYIPVGDAILYFAKVKEQLQDKIDFNFEPAYFIFVSLNKNITYSENISEKIKDRYIPINPVLEETYSTISEKLYTFYQYEFLDNPEILDFLSNYLLFSDRLEDYIYLASKFSKNNCLPLKHDLLLILLQQHENKVSVSSLPEDVISIVYKFFYLELNASDKIFFYDTFLKGDYDNLRGIAFETFQYDFSGIRNAYPIFNQIKYSWNHLSELEKQEFIEVYKKTNHYLDIFFLLKKQFSKEEIKEWLKEVNNENGKLLSRSSEDLVNLNRPEILRTKFKRLKNEDKLFLLQPFEILLLLNSTESILIRDRIDSQYLEKPHSYILNRAKAVISFFDNEFFSFLKYANLSGRFQHQTEMLYIKALTLIELNRKDEGNIILNALQQKFPRSSFLKNAVDEFEV